jgi:hypothetical protein
MLFYEVTAAISKLILFLYILVRGIVKRFPDWSVKKDY